MRRATIAVLAVGAWLLAAPASAQQQLPARPQSESLDSEAPAGAPPHWLPGERWVMQHWLPFDEDDLYAELGVDRGDVWRWLRDDSRTLADLARQRGRDPAQLAAALVAPWKGRLREPHRLAVLESRALRTLTQGHLSQHLLFHSLHQDAIPDHAPAIFGVSSREEFQALRRSELSPVQICRLNGLPRAHAEREAIRTLKAELRAGVEGQAIPASQARTLLRRQLRQVPRWLQQTRYNGPPPLRLPRASVATASNYSNNAVLAHDGSRVAYEGYEAALAGAKVRGEIGVLAVSGSAAPVLASAPGRGARRTPRSAYNPAVSADGRFVAFEAAEGNLNFAKRYGQMQVFVRDLAGGGTRLASRSTLDLGASRRRPVPRSAYDPSISGDGRLVAYESSESGRGRLDVFVRDLRASRARRLVPPAGTGRLSEPALAADGRSVAFTGLEGERSGVWTSSLAGGRPVRVSPVGAEAYEPSVSRSGRFVAYTRLLPGRRSRVEVRDLRTGATRVAAPAPGAGLPPGASASEPSLSADGRRVAFTLRPMGMHETSVLVADVATGATELVSRRSGALGPAAAGSSGRPSLSGDGRRVAFTSDAYNLAPEKCNGARGIFVRDLGARTTRLVSRGDGANRYAGPTKGSSTGGDLVLALRCGRV